MPDTKLINGPVHNKPPERNVTNYLGSFEYLGQNFDLWDCTEHGRFLHVNKGGCSPRGTTLGKYVPECKAIVGHIIFGKKHPWLKMCARVRSWSARQCQ